MDGFSFQSVKTTLVQSGAVLQLPDLLSERGLSRPLFVTDAMLIELGVVTPQLIISATVAIAFQCLTGSSPIHPNGSWVRASLLLGLGL